MIGTYFLWLAIGESCLFLAVLAYATIEESFLERRLRREELLERALVPSAAQLEVAEADSVAALLAPLRDIAA